MSMGETTMATHPSTGLSILEEAQRNFHAATWGYIRKICWIRTDELNADQLRYILAGIESFVRLEDKLSDLMEAYIDGPDTKAAFDAILMEMDRETRGAWAQCHPDEPYPEDDEEDEDDE
jgi:hypothetical protein